MTISPVPPSMDVTVTSASGVVPMPTQPPAVLTVPAMSPATVISHDVEIRPGPWTDRTVQRLGPAATSVGEGVPTVVLSLTPRSVPTSSVPMGSDVPVVPLSVPLSSLVTSSGQSPLLLLRRWLGVIRVTRRYPCPPIVSRQYALRMVRKRVVSSMYPCITIAKCSTVSPGGGAAAVDDRRF